MRISTTVLAMTVASAAITAATVTAVPADAEPDPGWRATVDTEAVTSTLDAGVFVLSADQRSVAIRDDRGQQLTELPLTVQLDGLEYALRQEISPDARRLTLTPDAALRAVAAARPIASPVENQLALGELAGKLTTASLLGTVGGTVIGLLVGAVIGLGSCLIVGPGCLATAPAALAAFAGAGGLAGTLLAGGGTLATGLWKYLSTVQAAPGESAYAEQGGLLNPDGTGVPDANLRLPKISIPSGSSSLSAGH